MRALGSEPMADEVHADHEVDRVAVRLHERTRAHRAGQKMRRLFGIERRDDHATPVVLVRECACDLDEHRDRGCIVVRAVKDVATDLAQVIEVRTDEDVPVDVAPDLRDHVRTAASRDGLLARVEPRRAQRIDHVRARQIATRCSRSAPRTLRTAQSLDQVPHDLQSKLTS